MANRRLSTPISLVIVGVIAVGVVEASLLGLLVVMSAILGIDLGIQAGPAYFVMQLQQLSAPQVTLFNAATVGSFLFTAACGVGAATSTFRRWRRVA
jgi:hypothetical protein